MMKVVLKRLKQILQKLTVFDWLIIFVGLGAVVFFSSVIFKQEQWLQVEVKVQPEQWWWDYRAVPYWMADSVQVGDAQYDGWGRKIAEVLETHVYEAGGGRKDTYFLVNLKVNYQPKKKQAQFNRQVIEIGKPIMLELGSVGVQGVVMNLEGVELGEETVTKVVKAELLSTTPWIAEAIMVGDQMKDTHGRVIAEVLDKEVTFASMVTTNDRGDVLVRQDPLNRDVALTLRLETRKRNELYYFREDQVVKIGNELWIMLSNVNISGASIQQILE